MHPHRTTRSFRWRSSLAIVIVAALAVTVGAAIGSPTKSSATTLTALIGSSGPAETFAVNNAAKAFTKQTGIQVNVVVASDLGQQLAQGFASGNPPDIFYLGNDQVATYAKAGSLATLDNLKNVKAFYPSLRAAYTYKGQLYARRRTSRRCARRSTPHRGRARSLTAKDYPKTWEQLGRRREEAHAERAGRPLHRPRVPPPRRLHDRGRRLARLQGRQDRHGQQQGERRGVHLRQGDAQGRHVEAHEPARRRLGRRGVRQGARAR